MERLEGIWIASSMQDLAALSSQAQAYCEIPARDQRLVTCLRVALRLRLTHQSHYHCPPKKDRMQVMTITQQGLDFPGKSILPKYSQEQ